MQLQISLEESKELIKLVSQNQKIRGQNQGTVYLFSPTFLGFLPIGLS